jgi:plastocyanin domain-containing protein
MRHVLAALAAFAVLTLAHTASAADKAAAKPAAKETTPAAKPAAGSPRLVEMTVTPDGFVPAEVKVKKGEPVQLVITRKTDQTCATEIVIKDLGINQKLPLNQPVAIVFTPTKAGNLRYACGMDMISGQLIVE